MYVSKLDLIPLNTTAPEVMNSRNANIISKMEDGLDITLAA
jgi:hypothetical protein